MSVKVLLLQFMIRDIKRTFDILLKNESTVLKINPSTSLNEEAKIHKFYDAMEKSEFLTVTVW